jgi:hypothetical protein
MAIGFDVVRLELSFGRDKLDEWLVAELDREQFSRLTTYRPKKGKAQTVDAMLSAVEAAAEKRGGDDDDEDDAVDSTPYDHFKMRIVGDKLSVQGRLTGDASWQEAFALSAITARAAELGGKGELVLLGGQGDDGVTRNLRIIAQKGNWSETALSDVDATALRG